MRRQSYNSLRLALFALLCLRLGAAHAAGVVTACTEDNLRAALAGGGTVTFSCDGTIALAKTLVIDTNTALDATGHSMTLSGNNAVQVLEVNPGVQCALTDLIITQGVIDTTHNDTPGGSGIFNDGGTLTLTHCVLGNNATDVEDYLTYASALGGGLLNHKGQVTLNDCVFSDNSVYSLYGVAGGGGFYNDGGTAALTNCAFTGNSITGLQQSNDYASVPSVGGALANQGGTVTLMNCGFYQDSITGTAGLDGYGSIGGAGGEALGGALYNASGNITSTNCTFAANQVVGGPGGIGTPDDGVGIIDGGNGGDGLGGAIYNASGTQILLNCTIVSNSVAGSGGGTGGLDFEQRGLDGAPGIGHGGGITVAGGNVSLHNTILGPNSDVNVYGTIEDSGHNLSSDATPRFGPSSHANAFTGLGPLAANGGPTQTFALYAHSQAIDAADNSACPATDQRGVARPQGRGCDIGALESTKADLIADTLAPTVQITQPGDNAPRSNLNTQRGTAADNSGLSGVARVDVFIQRQRDRKYWTGTTWGARTPLSTVLTNNATQWERLSGNPRGSNLMDGLYAIQAQAFDQSGNHSAYARINTRLDLIAPSVAITTPTPGANLAVLPALSGTAMDNVGGSGIDHVELLLQRYSDHKFWTGQAWKATPTTLPASYTDGQWSYADQLLGGSDFEDLVNSSYLLVARAYDRAGNSTRATSAFRVTQIAGPDESLVVLSNAQFDSDTGIITLTFSGALDPTTANAVTSYVATQDPQSFSNFPINSVVYNSSRHTVTIEISPVYTYNITYPPPYPPIGPLIVSWQGLLDAQKKKVRDNNVMFTIPPLPD